MRAACACSACRTSCAMPSSAPARCAASGRTSCRCSRRGASSRSSIGCSISASSPRPSATWKPTRTSARSCSGSSGSPSVRLVLAQMKHETNTFSPVPTPLARFGHGRAGPIGGQEALEEFRGTGSALGAFIDLAERAGAEIVLPIAAQAWPSGRVEQGAYEHIAGRIVAAVAQGCDAVLLDLHGAMVTERFEDGEGELLARVRRVAPKLPIGVAHDMHANVFPGTGRTATSLAGYQTYPHVDMYETGVRAAQPIFDLLNKKC